MVDGVGPGIPAGGEDADGVNGAAAANRAQDGEARREPQQRQDSWSPDGEQAPAAADAPTAALPLPTASASAEQPAADQPAPIAPSIDPGAETAVIRHVPVLPPSVYAAENGAGYAAGGGAPYTTDDNAPANGDSNGNGAGPGPGSAFSRLPRRGVIAAGGVLALAAIGGVAAAVTGGSGGSGKNNGAGTGGGNGGAGVGGGSSPSPSPTYPVPAFSTVPANGDANVDPSKPVTVSVANGTITSVQLSGGQETSGTLSDDKSSWTSNGVLKLDTAYQVQIQAADRGGKAVSKSISFTTLKPSATIGVLEMWPGSDVSVGVGQPIRVQFTNYVPSSYRADVEKACVVTTNPPVAGAWNWVDSDTMDWRPQEYWQTGTQVSAALNLSGVRAGTHQFFVKNHSLNFTIRDTDLRLIVDTKAFKATAYQNGQVIRTFPIDTGTNDPRFITWSGTLAVLGKGNPVEMKGDYGNGDKYDEFVTWATQITYSGTYVHAAPWDGQIGQVNSSHGCIHARTSDATWFYNLAHVGDVVQVTGTGKTVSTTNGFGDWTLSWTKWLSGSAYGATLGGKPVSG
ncbi:MAG TPA: Ig-like domain-containing protein [Actinocrinis sp.]|nr:Ig-like domain-containing protein [Actinocrinis sp.]